MNSGFDNYLSTHFEQIGSANGRERRAEVLRTNYLELFRALDPAATVLEIGPGHGELLGILRNEVRLPGVCAIDLSQEVVDLCNARFDGGVLLVNDTRQFLEQHPSSFDLIVLLHVLEHVPRQQIVSLLEAIRGALRPGGQVVIEVPNMANPVIGLTGRYSDFTHEVGFTETSLAQVLRMASFNNLEVRAFWIPRTSVARWVQWLLRRALELFLRLTVRLYSARPEINSANIVAIARKEGGSSR